MLVQVPGRRPAPARGLRRERVHHTQQAHVLHGFDMASPRCKRCAAVLWAHAGKESPCTARTDAADAPRPVTPGLTRRGTLSLAAGWTTAAARSPPSWRQCCRSPASRASAPTTGQTGSMPRSCSSPRCRRPATPLRRPAPLRWPAAPLRRGRGSSPRTPARRAASPTQRTPQYPGRRHRRRPCCSNYCFLWAQQWHWRVAQQEWHGQVPARRKHKRRPSLTRLGAARRRPRPHRCRRPQRTRQAHGPRLRQRAAQVRSERAPPPVQSGQPRRRGCPSQREPSRPRPAPPLRGRLERAASCCTAARHGRRQVLAPTRRLHHPPQGLPARPARPPCRRPRSAMPCARCRRRSSPLPDAAARWARALGCHAAVQPLAIPCNHTRAPRAKLALFLQRRQAPKNRSSLHSPCGSSLDSLGYRLRSDEAPACRRGARRKKGAAPWGRGQRVSR